MARPTVTISGLARSTKPLELSAYGRCSSIMQKRWKERGQSFNLLLMLKSPRDSPSMTSIFRI